MTSMVARCGRQLSLLLTGKGPIKEVNAFMVRDGLYLCPGDVLLADYEEELPSA